MLIQAHELNLYAMSTDDTDYLARSNAVFVRVVVGYRAVRMFRQWWGRAAMPLRRAAGAFRRLRVNAALPSPKSAALLRRPRRNRFLLLALIKLLFHKLRLRLAAVRAGQLRVVLLRKHNELGDAFIGSDAGNAWESRRWRSPLRGWRRTT